VKLSCSHLIIVTVATVTACDVHCSLHTDAWSPADEPIYNRSLSQSPQSHRSVQRSDTKQTVLNGQTLDVLLNGQLRHSAAAARGPSSTPSATPVKTLVIPSGTTCLSTSHLRRHSRFSDNDSRPFCFPVSTKTLSYDSCVTITIHHYCLDTCGPCNN